MKKLVTVRQALEDKTWLGTMLGGSSFTTMRTLLIAAMGEPLTPTELETFTRLTGRTGTPCGKTRAIGTLAAYLAGCIDYRSILGPGERGMLPILAASVAQAEQAINFIKGIFTDVPRFAATRSV